jgi:hypothetical protein
VVYYVFICFCGVLCFYLFLWCIMFLFVFVVYYVFICFCGVLCFYLMPIQTALQRLVLLQIQIYDSLSVSLISPPESYFCNSKNG